MRKWRVGTLSMGVTLVLFGAVLLQSMWKGGSAYDTLLVWWPVAFILVGLEIIMYVLTIRKENAIVYYDVFSILFVGFLCVACLGLSLLASSGLLQEIRGAVSAVEETVELPVVQQAVDPSVKKIVVDAPNGQVTVDKAAVNELHVMSSYERMVSAGSLSTAGSGLEERLVSVHSAGDIMYVSIRMPPVKRGIHSHYPYLNPTVVVPQNVQVEVRGGYTNG